MEDADGGAGVDDVDGAAGVDDAEGMPGGMDGHDHVFYVDPEPWSRCRGTRCRRRRGSNAEVVKAMLTQISKGPRMSTTPKGAGWKVIKLEPRLCVEGA